MTPSVDAAAAMLFARAAGLLCKAFAFVVAAAAKAAVWMALNVTTTARRLLVKVQEHVVQVDGPVPIVFR